MRELKFRAYLKEERKYVYPTLILVDFGVVTGIAYTDIDEITYQPKERRLIIEDVVIEQATGLKDKNGKKIWEGDIVEIDDKYDEYGKNAGQVYAIYFNYGGFRCKPKYPSSIARGDKGYWVEDGNDFIVIGNIHDNPELLEGK